MLDAAHEREEIRAKEWTTADELLAQVVEQIAILRVEAFAIAGVPRWKLPEPYRIPRPGEEKERVLTPSQFARLTVAV